MKKILRLFIVSLIVLAPCSYAESDFKPFSVNGERLDLVPPNQWKLASMQGDPNGNYLVEYTPELDDINNWKDGYLLIQRIHYPAQNIMEELTKLKTRISDASLHAFIDQAKKSCTGKHSEMNQRTNTFNNLYFAVGGGYCDGKTSKSRYGEGAFVALIEGRDFLYKIQYGWRPQSPEEQHRSPWGIDEATAIAYLESIKSAQLCDESKRNCKTNYSNK
jgi:hypothetical protein